MGIKIKYDPVGSLFLGSFQAGANQGKERRRRELMALAQRNAEMQQQSREKMLDRQFQALRDFQNNNVNIGNIGAPAGGGVELRGNKTRRLALAQQNQQNQLATQTARLPAGAIMAPPGFGNQGDVFMPRDLVEQQQRQKAQQDEADLAFKRRGLGMAPIPDGVKLNQGAATRWNELEEAKRQLMGGRDFDPNLPESQDALNKIEAEQWDIESQNPPKTQADMANEETMWHDPNDGKFYPDRGDPSLGREQYVGGQPINDGKADQAAEKEKQTQQKEQRKQEIEFEKGQLDDDLKAIEDNDDDYTDDEAGRAKKNAAKKELRDAFREKWFPKPAVQEGGAPMEPPTGQPIEPADSSQYPGVLPSSVAQMTSEGFKWVPNERMQGGGYWYNPGPGGSPQPSAQTTVPKEWTPETTDAAALREKADTQQQSSITPAMIDAWSARVPALKTAAPKLRDIATRYAAGEAISEEDRITLWNAYLQAQAAGLPRGQ